MTAGGSPPPPSGHELRQAIAEAAEHDRRLAEEHAALRETLSRLEDDRSDLEHRVLAAEEEDRELSARVSQRDERLADLRREEDALREECALLEAGIVGAERQVARLRRERAEQGGGLARARELAVHARESLDEARASILRMDYRLSHDPR